MSDTVVPAYRDDTWFPAGRSRADQAGWICGGC